MDKLENINIENNSLTKNANYWIKHYNLAQHPEGWFYKCVYQYNDTIETNRKGSTRYLCTSIIYYLSFI